MFVSGGGLPSAPRVSRLGATMAPEAAGHRGCMKHLTPPRGPQERSRRSVRDPSGQGGGWRRWIRPRASCEGGEQRGSARRAAPARSHAQAGRRAGLEAQPERLLPARGARENPARGANKKAGSQGCSNPEANVARHAGQYSGCLRSTPSGQRERCIAQSGTTQ
jgi:hypothetical protein